ncbi:hypothetical protein GCM10020295_02300 [Streptomyces cinereospinus]
MCRCDRESRGAEPVTRGTTLSLPTMLADLEELVLCESYSADHAAVARSAEAVGALGARLLGGPGRRRS